MKLNAGLEIKKLLKMRICWSDKIISLHQLCCQRGRDEHFVFVMASVFYANDNFTCIEKNQLNECPL